MIADALALFDFLKKYKDQYITRSAIFSWDCELLEGSDEIEVEFIPVTDNSVQWYYKVKPVVGYVFVHFPLVPGSVYVDNGRRADDSNPDADIFRYVGNLFSSVISGGNPNVKTSFIVVGYRPSDLLNIKEATGA